MASIGSAGEHLQHHLRALRLRHRARRRLRQRLPHVEHEHRRQHDLQHHLQGLLVRAAATDADRDERTRRLVARRDHRPLHLRARRRRDGVLQHEPRRRRLPAPYGVTVGGVVRGVEGLHITGNDFRGTGVTVNGFAPKWDVRLRVRLRLPYAQDKSIGRSEFSGNRVGRCGRRGTTATAAGPGA